MMTKLSEAARAMGRKGGKSKSKAKLAAIAQNARGPHKRKPASAIKPASLKRRQMRDAARKEMK